MDYSRRVCGNAYRKAMAAATIATALNPKLSRNRVFADVFGHLLSQMQQWQPREQRIGGLPMATDEAMRHPEFGFRQYAEMLRT